MLNLLEEKLQLVYHPVNKLAEFVGQPVDQVQYFAAIFASFGASLVLGRITSVPMAKLWSTFTGLCAGFFIYGKQYGWNIAFVLVNWALMRFLPRVQASYAMTIFSTISLLWSGIWAKYLKEEFRASEEGSSLDVDLIIMINFCKAHMLAVNYENAGKLDNAEASKYFTERERFYAEPLRKALAIDDFFHYFFFCAVSFSGMVHEYRDFEDFINRKGNYSNIPRHKLLGSALKRFA